MDGLRERHPALQPMNAVLVSQSGGSLRRGRNARERGLQAQHNYWDEMHQSLQAVNSDELHSASQNGQVQVVQHMLRAGADVETTAQDGCTPLLVASAAGHLPVVKLLLRAGAAIEATEVTAVTEVTDVTASHSCRGKPISAKAKRHAGFTPLHWASAGGHLLVVRALLQAHADAEARTRDGRTPLLLASAGGHEGVSRELLKAGAAIDAKARDGATALPAASEQGHGEVVAALLQSGACTGGLTRYGCSPLYAAAANGHAHVVEVLLVAGADKQARGLDGRTPLEVARSLVKPGERNNPVVLKLLQYGAQEEAVKIERHRAARAWAWAKLPPPVPAPAAAAAAAAAAGSRSGSECSLIASGRQHSSFGSAASQPGPGARGCSRGAGAALKKQLNEKQQGGGFEAVFTPDRRMRLVPTGPIMMRSPAKSGW